MSNKAVIATAFPDATAAGATMLRRGGTAMDAACAAAFALAVCEPGESGLGGQSTMLVRLGTTPDGPGGRCVVIDGHSRAPAGVSRKTMRRRDQKRGIRSCVIPSTVATLAEAHRRFGRLPFADVVAPAIALAAGGYAMTAGQRRLFKWTLPFIKPGSPEAATFLKPDGTLHEPGELFRQPALAGTLERLARDGPEDFYTGSIAREIIEDMARRGGLVTGEDLRTLGLPVERRAIEVEYRGRRVVSIPPPGGGVQALVAMRVLGQLIGPASAADTPAGAPSGTPADAAEWEVALAEATWTAFAEREKWPDHPKATGGSLLRFLLSDERVAGLASAARARIAGRPDSAPVPADSMGEAGNTTHLCAADANGMIVSLTQSIQSVFGSKVVHPTLGFLYNNYLSTCPRDAHPYRLGPGSMPQSNATPTMVFDADGSPMLALGSAGSRRITSSVVRVLSGVLDRGLGLADAVAAPRAHALVNRTLWMESSMSAPSAARLRRAFPRVRDLAPRSYKAGAVQAIGWSAGGDPIAAADPRRDGTTAVIDMPTDARDAAGGGA